MSIPFMCPKCLSEAHIGTNGTTEYWYCENPDCIHATVPIKVDNLIARREQS